MPRNQEAQTEETEAQPLPEVELSPLTKSEEPVAEKGKKVKIQTYGDYFVVCSGREEIKLLSKLGNEITEFRDVAKTSKPVNIWQLKGGVFAEIYSWNNHNWGIDFISDPQSQLRLKDRQKLQPRIRGFSETMLAKRLRRSGGSGMRLADVRNENENETLIGAPQNTSVICTDKYLIIYDDETKGYIVYFTQNENGVSIPPRNWQRIDTVDLMHETTSLPKDLNDLLEKISVVKGVLRQVNDRYNAIISEDRIEIVSQDNVENAVFGDNLDDVGKNFCVDPTNSNIVYYCRGASPVELIKLDLSGNPPFVPQQARFPVRYEKVNGLQMDPTGNFFVLSTGEGLVFLTRDNLEEVGKKDKLESAFFDENGELIAMDENNFVVSFRTNLGEMKSQIAKRRAAQVARGIKARDLFAPEKGQGGPGEQRPEDFEHLLPVIDQNKTAFEAELAKVQKFEDIALIRTGLVRLKTQLASTLTPAEVNYIADQISPLIEAKEKELAGVKINEVLATVKQKIAERALSFARIADIRGDFDKLDLLKPNMEQAVADEVAQLQQEFNVRAQEYFHEHAEQVMTDVDGIVTDTKKQLQAIKSLPAFDMWMEVTRPQVRQRLMLILKSCPPEATDVCQKILTSMDDLENTYREYEQRFQNEYAQVREAASEVVALQIEGLQAYVDSFFDRAGRHRFANVEEARAFFEQSEDYRTIWQEIESLRGSNPDAAKIMERAVKARAANFLGEVDLRVKTQIAPESGQQMVAFGEVLFPRWEAKVKERKERKVNLVFIENKVTKGPGVPAEQIMGDVGIQITDAEGHVTVARLYEGTDREDEWRYGAVNRLGARDFPVAASYLSQGEYRKVRSDYLDWHKENSPLRAELQKHFANCQEIFLRRPKNADGSYVGPEDQAFVTWQKEYEEAFQTYAKFAQEHHVAMLRQFDLAAGKPDREFINGKGFVPEWQSHWCIDDQTEQDLAEIAELAKMQLELHEGIINLAGHAGTGKDVLVKMFSNRTNRPYFAMDCTKWTTEFELSEDVVLEAEGGATKTIKVPSVVLNAIRTPGALMYFNEINGMPEQAQIFLHALFDEKRTITLKTSSGVTIKADPSVLFMSSMNPNYPGTFNPQYATRSRMVDVQIGYPPLTRDKDPGDPNPNPPYNSSEALRMAREVDSLDDLTYDPNPKRNEFVQLWDRYVNGIQNGAPEPTQIQKFDMDTILALVQFGNNLRNAFVAGFERTGASPNTLIVEQPLTGREFRRCAYVLSTLPAEEKIRMGTAGPETLARDLLKRFFLSHIDSLESRARIEQAMANWSLSRRT